MAEKNECKLSVVVLVYNAEEFLEECLDSLVNQTLEGIEIICVNDESKDSSLNILKKYAKKYDNITVIDQKNQGGANAANNGLKMAKGEYVTVMDSDDVLALDAYEKLYTKAKQTDSDIVSGKPYKYINGVLKTLRTHNNMWDSEKVMDKNRDIYLYNDTSYWNKVFKRSFVEENDLYMIPGRLYADIPLSVLTFLKSSKTTFIPDFVYYWRKREMNTSITKNRYKIDNMLDKLGLYDILKGYFEDQDLFEQVIKLLLERFYLPIEGVLDNEEFKNVYFNRMREILSDINDVLNNKYADNLITLYNYLILNNQDDVVVEFMNNYLDVTDTVYEDGKTYWNLKYFRNPKYNYPDEIFEINSMLSNFIQIENISLGNGFFNIDNVSLPENINFGEVNVIFEGKTFKYESKTRNTFKFKLENSGDNIYNGKILLEEINNINAYYVYLEFVYGDKIEKYRIIKNHFPSNMKNRYFTDKAGFYFSYLGNLVFINPYLKNIFKVDVNKKGMKIVSKAKGSSNFDIFIQHNAKNDRVKFHKLLKDNKIPTNIFELKWDNALDENIEYNFFIEINKKMYKLTDDYLFDFENQSCVNGKNQINVFTNNEDILSINANYI